MVRVSRDALTSVCQRNRRKWLSTAGGDRQDSRRGQAGQIDVGRGSVEDVQRLSRKISDVSIVAKEIGRSGVVDAVSAANDGASVKPWHVIAEPERGSDIVPVIGPDLFVRVG